MFRCPPFNEGRSPKYVYLHRLEKIYDNRPMLLANDLELSVQRKLFLLKRWRDERTVYLYESFRDTDFSNDAILKKLNLLIHILRKNPYPQHLMNFHHKKYLEQRCLRVVSKLQARREATVNEYGE